MKPQAFQHGEIRDENDKIIKAGAYGKNTPFCTKNNDGILDYIINNLEWLYDKVTNGLSGIYLSLTGGTLTGDVINEAKYVKNAKSIDATATGAGEDEETIIMARDKSGQDLGFINILRHKNNKNVQLRNRVINKSWSDLRVVQDDDGKYWAEYAGGLGTELLIPSGNNSNKIPTTAWIQNELKQNNIKNEYKSIWGLCTKKENEHSALIRSLNFCVNIAMWIGENKAHSVNDLLFILPSEYTPKDEQRVPFTGHNSKISGIVKIATDGKVTVYSISSTTIADRIAFNCMYFI